MVCTLARTGVMVLRVIMVADHDVERAAPIAGRIDLALREQRAQNDGLAGEALPA